MKQRLSQQQLQKLVPMQLMVARLVQLSQSDIEKAILEEIEKNPLLELDDTAPANAETQGQSTDWADETSHISAPRNSALDVIEVTQAEELDFFERLLKQIKESGLNDEEIMIAEEIIGSLDEDGFLPTPITNIAYKLSVEPKKAESVLFQIQKLAPPGVGARDLKECMLLQLKANYEEPYVIEIIEECFEDYMNGEIDKVCDKLELSEEDMAYAEEQIAKLNPRPAAGHDDFMKKTIVPDLVLRHKDGHYFVALIESGTPGIRLSDTYLSMINTKDIDKNTKSYLSNHKQAAEWFIKAIEQRKQSMIAIASAIVRRQQDYLSGKREHPLPMVMKDIAEDTGLDISTVSRVVNGKYMQTPTGNYELRYYFSEKTERSDGMEASTRDLEGDLMKIIESEDKTKPLSDEALQLALTEKGYNIARRTVAKYREKMGILGSRERRKT